MLRDLGITPSKALGQHFLHDRKIVRRIVNESGVGPGDIVIEVGPGLGILTRELAASVARVVAIERDSKLAEGLRRASIPGAEVVEADALEVTPGDLAETSPYHVVANLPYSVGTAIIQRFQESAHPPMTMTVMLQREVAERIVASPPDMNLLAVGVQLHGTPRILFRVGKGAFVPPPNVDSAIIRIETLAQPRLPHNEYEPFFRVVRAGFSQPRKQLTNNLVHGLGLSRDAAVVALEAAGVDPTSRPERLSVDDWLAVYRQTLNGAG